MNLFDLNNDILIKIEEEVAIKRKHKLFLSNLKKHRDQFYIDGGFSNFDSGYYDYHAAFRNGYWYKGVYRCSGWYCSGDGLLIVNRDCIMTD